MSLAHSGGGAGRRFKRLPYDINLWRYLLPSVEKSSMRDHYSFSALTAPPPPPSCRRFAAVLAAMAWNLNACTSWPATPPHTRRATTAPHSRAPQRHTPASWLSEARRNSVKKSERQRRCRWLRRERVKRFQVQLQASKRMPAPLGGIARRVAWRAAVAQAEHAVHEQCIQSTLSRP